MSDNATGKQVAYLAPGLALPILYDIKRRGNRHAVEEPPVNVVVERDQDCPEGLPFYETRVGDYDLMVGEFMISCLFIRLPQNCKDSEPALHAVGRSLILWYYALEHSSGRPVLMKNYKLSVVSDDSIKDGFLLEDRAISILKIGQNLFGSEEGHIVEQRLLETILLYQYVHLEHYWKEVSINDKDLIEYYHCIKNEVNGKYSCYFEPLTPMAFNNNILDSTWKEYLLSRKYNIKHILNVSNSLLKHILKRSYNIEFVDFIIRTTVFCLVQDMQYKEAREKLKLLSNTPINKKYIEAELKYIEKSECTS